MGFWHDHGIIDFSVCSLRGRDSDVEAQAKETCL